MSKVDDNYKTLFDNFHYKLKLKKNLRRKETAHIKKKRIEGAKIIGNNKYSYKYYMRENSAYKITKEWVPTHIVPIRSLELQKTEDGHKIYKFITTDYKTVPGHYRTIRKRIKGDEKPPYLARWSDSQKLKKYLKKVASKKSRDIDFENTPGKGNGYKKSFALKWELY